MNPIRTRIFTEGKEKYSPFDLLKARDRVKTEMGRGLERSQVGGISLTLEGGGGVVRRVEGFIEKNENFCDLIWLKDPTTIFLNRVNSIFFLLRV